jgi:3-dehydroquinate synthase class II
MALVYAVSAAAPVDSDVVERRLTIEVDGVVEMRTLPPSATELGEIKVARDAEVLLALVDADGSGNVSEPATFEFVAVDTIPPAKPGEFGVSLLRQED